MLSSKQRSIFCAALGDERKSSQKNPFSLQAQVSSIYSNVWASILPSIGSDRRRLHEQVELYLWSVFCSFSSVFALETWTIVNMEKLKFCLSFWHRMCVGRQVGLKYCRNFRFWERRESFAAAVETFIPRLNLILLPIVNLRIKSLLQNFFPFATRKVFHDATGRVFLWAKRIFGIINLFYLSQLVFLCSHYPCTKFKYKSVDVQWWHTKSI